jgi:paraquat-inducible protein B
MSNPPQDNNRIDHGQVVATRRRGIAWVWIFPILAGLAAGWLFYNQWVSQGPTIEIHFDEAPGIEPRKTKLIYRGVESGTVESVRVEEDLGRVVVRVRLQAFASRLAAEETTFWIDRPMISLTEFTGLESIIRGNSIKAITSGGEPCYEFKGLSSPPATPLDPTSFKVKIEGAEIPFLSSGAPVFHRGVRVGFVRQKEFDEAGKPYLSLSIREEFRSTVRSTSHFWALPAMSVTLGQHGITLNTQGVDAIVQGGIAYDHFGLEGNPLARDTTFRFHASKEAAMATGRVLRVTFTNGRGLLPENTPVCYLGQPIGLVESVTADPTSQSVTASVRLQPAFDNLATANTVFTLVKPKISLNEISGLDTLLTGAYVAFEPGTANELTDTFLGRSANDKEWQDMQDARDGIKATLVADALPSIGKGAPVTYRGVVVGTVLEKTLKNGNQPALEIVVRPEFRDAFTDNARFWRVPATSIKAGPGFIEVDIEGLDALLHGGVAFDTFGKSGKPVNADSTFTLFDDEQTARAKSEPIQIRFDNGRGLVAGRSELRYLGVPVGIIDSVQARDGYVQVAARLNEGYEFLRREGSIFSVVRPNISLQGVKGLETLVSGVYIECIPGSSKKLTNSFVGMGMIDLEQIVPGGLSVKLSTPSSPLSVGSAVFYRGIKVGHVTEKTLSTNGQEIILTAVIDRRYSHLVRSNSRFWESSGLKASMGFLKFHIEAESLMALDGRISFATPENTAMGPAAKDGEKFTLHATPKPEWQNWNPFIAPTN